jgi:hypothetical protein
VLVKLIINTNKVLAILLFVTTLFIYFKYYTKRGMLLNIEKFEKKNLGERRIWAVITFVIPILPLILFFLILRLRHPF